MKYLLIDTANMFFRARHVAFRASDPWEKVGYALHITFTAINKVYRQFDADHVVFCLKDVVGAKTSTSLTRRTGLLPVPHSQKRSRKKSNFFGRPLMSSLSIYGSGPIAVC